jgi:hypothetical protein
MRPIIQDLQTMPPLLSPILAPQTALGTWVQNAILGFVGWTDC